MKKRNKITMSLATMLLLCIGLCVTSFALAFTLLEVNDNRVETGNIAIDLNGGNAIIEEEEFLFEPGMTVQKEFYIQNNSTWAIYYKLYFSNIQGDLAETLDVTIFSPSGQVLAHGKMADLTMENVPAFDGELAIGEKQVMQVMLHYPESAGNRTQKQTLTFQFSAIGVQTKNNPNKQFV